MSEWVTFDSLKAKYRKGKRHALPPSEVYWVAAQSISRPGRQAVVLAHLDFHWHASFQDLLAFGIKALPGQGYPRDFDILDSLEPVAFRPVVPGDVPQFEGWNHG